MEATVLALLSVTAHLRTTSVMVEVADLPGVTELKSADLTAMRAFEERDEYSALVAREFADITSCGVECCKRKNLREADTRGCGPMDFPRKSGRSVVLVRD